VSQYIRLYPYLAPIYDPFARAVSSKARTEAVTLLRDAVRSCERSPPGNRHDVRVLVAGCGTGLSLLPILKISSVEWVEAVDASPEMLRRARHKVTASGRPDEARIAYRRADIRQLSYPDRAFDAGISLYVLDLLSESDQRRALRSIARVLRRGGVLITVTVARPERLHEYPWVMLADGLPSLLGGSRPTDLQPQLEEAGFTIEARMRRTQLGLASHILHSRLPE